jgi:hypothetical protein
MLVLLTMSLDVWPQEQLIEAFFMGSKANMQELQQGFMLGRSLQARLSNRRIIEQTTYTERLFLYFIAHLLHAEQGAMKSSRNAWVNSAAALLCWAAGASASIHL